jgi:hypothetical protein
MAMAKCRECGTEVSDTAKTCPKCGVTKPVKKMSVITKGLLGFFGLAFAISIISSKVQGPQPQASGTPPLPQLDPKEVAINAMRMDKTSWHAGGFNNILMLSAKVHNEGAKDVKDITIECDTFANSGTQIGTVKGVVLERIKAGGTLNVREFNMGFINQQTASTRCAVVNVVLM